MYLRLNIFVYLWLHDLYFKYSVKSMLIKLNTNKKLAIELFY